MAEKEVWAFDSEEQLDNVLKSHRWITRYRDQIGANNSPQPANQPVISLVRITNSTVNSVNGYYTAEVVWHQQDQPGEFFNDVEQDSGNTVWVMFDPADFGLVDGDSQIEGIVFPALLASYDADDVPIFNRSWKAGGGINSSALIDSAGYTGICKVTSGGNVIDIKLRQKLGRMFRCVSVDECCMTAWWCVSNSQVTLTTSCCTPATLTRILRFALTSKTGDCADLPDLVYLVHTGGTDLTWTSNGSDYWGKRKYSATFTISCSGATPKGTLVISGFTGGSTTTIPCDLTSTGVALGTFTYSGTEPDGCGGTTALSGTVDIAVSSWEDGGGAVTHGVVEFGEDEVPPWDATGPWKTEAEALACCREVGTADLPCIDPGNICSFQVYQSYTFTFSNTTGVAYNRVFVANRYDPTFPHYWDSNTLEPQGYSTVVLQCPVPGTDFIRAQFGAVLVTSPPAVYQSLTLEADMIADGYYTTPCSGIGFFRDSTCADVEMLIVPRKVGTVGFYTTSDCSGSPAGTADLYIS